MNSYTELATGLCYFDSTTGNYVDSAEQIELTATGAQAVHGAHRVEWTANANTAGGAVRLTTPEGVAFNSRVFGLCYWDPIAGTNVLIGQLKDSQGSVIGSNQVLYSSAFSAIKADLLYTYTKAGLEQNVILREQLPSPSQYGLNPDSARLQVMTEFFAPARPLSIFSIETNVSADDSIISFGSMYIGMGKAFLTGVADGSTESSPVTKHWTTLDGRTFLIEEVPFSVIASMETSLPLHASILKPSTPISRTAALRLPRQTNPTTASGTMKVANSVAKEPGFLVDYSMVNSGTNLTFQSDTTYYVSGSVSLYGTNTWEGGTIIKFAPGVGMSAVPTPVTLQLNFLTDRYRPVIFTAQDDDSVGDPISGSTGNPWTHYYANPALALFGTSATLAQLRISFAQQALSFGGVTALVRDAQFVNCSNGVTGGGITLTLENALFAGVFAPFNNLSTGSTITSENLTFGSNQFLLTIGNTNSTPLMSFTNCVFGQVTNLAGYPASSPSPYGSYTPVGDYNGFYGTSSFGSHQFPSTPNPFQSLGAGNYYLTNNSTFLNVGTTTIDPALLTDLQSLTTYAPVIIPSGWLTTNSLLSPQAPRDTNVVLNLGYHYSPLDWALNAAISNATVTVLPGTALGCYNSYGIWLYTNGVFNCTGNATNINYIVRYNTVQEQSSTNWIASWMGSFATPPAAGTSSAEVSFTELSVLGGDIQIYADDDVPCPITVQNCQFYNGENYVWGPSIASTNCLYRRVYSLIRDVAAGFPVSQTFNNNLFLDGELTIAHTSGGIWTFENNLFDQTAVTLRLGATIDICSNNAYVTGFATLVPENNDATLAASPAYETGALGKYYYPTNQPSLIHGGNTSASAAGLYYYTVTTNNVIDGANPVSIGFHYVAVGTNGFPLDLNNDGIPDYLEYPATFSDGYGTPDSWYWMTGLNPQVPGIGAADIDGDGLLNYQEYLYGTSPTVSEGFALWVSEPAVFSGIP